MAIHDEGAKVVLLNLVGEVADDWDAPKKKPGKKNEPEPEEDDDADESEDEEESEDESEDEESEDEDAEEEPRGIKKKVANLKGGSKCGKCGTRGHYASTCKRDISDSSDEDMDLKVQVDDLRAKGYTSLEIANELGISHSKVIKLWL